VTTIKINIIGQNISNISEDLLNILLKDRTTKRNICWATSYYISYGKEYYPQKPILLSRASVKGIEDEYDCTRFSHEKSACELGASFRPFTETLKDTIAWYRENGWIK